MKSIGGALVIILALIVAGCSSTSSTLTSPTPSKCVVATTLSLGTVGAGGGSGRANITAARECAWEASSESPWVVITDGQRGQGDGIVSFEVSANPSSAARTASLAINDQRVALTQDPAPCQFTLDHYDTSFGSPGGAHSVDVRAPGGCAWTATSQASWIAITSGATGTGSETVTFRVTESSGQRRGELLIAGQTFVVDQGTAAAPPPPACTTSINPVTVNMSAAGGSTSVSVTATAGCRWTASNAVSWLSVRNSSGTGNGTVQIDVVANTASTARTGTVTIAGQVLTVQQAAAEAPPPPPPSCAFTLSRSTVSVPGDPSSFSVDVDARSGCTWTSSSAASWLSVRNGSGNGDGTVTVDVAANAASTARTGSVTIAGQVLTVHQSGADAPPPPPPCRFNVAPTNTSAPAAGGSVAVAIDTAAGCTWTARSNASWLQVGRDSGSGPATIIVTASSNPSSTSRTDTVTIAGETVRVSQPGTPPACTYRISPGEARVSDDDERLSVSVDTQGGCRWDASSNVDWIDVTDGASGTGSGTVRLRVRENRGRDERTGTVAIAGQTFSVTQAGRPRNLEAAQADSSLPR
jgi:hypothetical protein